MNETKNIPDTYRLRRDGKPLLDGTEQDCWAYIHRNHSFSVSHALKYEGFTITKRDPKKVAENTQIRLAMALALRRSR